MLPHPLLPEMNFEYIFHFSTYGDFKTYCMISEYLDEIIRTMEIKKGDKKSFIQALNNKLERLNTQVKCIQEQRLEIVNKGRLPPVKLQKQHMDLDNAIYELEEKIKKVKKNR